MKLSIRYISACVSVILGFMILSSSIYAQEGTTRVRGNIYDMAAGGTGVAGLSVAVNCNGVAGVGVTDSNGLYVVDYSASACPAFSQVTSSVTYKGEPQSQTVWVSHNNRATLDFYFGSTAVPEFGAVTGIVAALGSGITYFTMKRKFSH